MNEKEFDTKKNLIVNYLPSTLSQDEVKSMFDRIGPVTKCKLVRHVTTGESLGYAFIEYPDEDLAACAINEINGVNMQDKTIKVSYARQSTPEIKNSNVYVAGLPDWVSEDKLHALFLPFGNILSYKVLTNPDGTTRGAGFVRFSLNTEASEAIEQMAGKTLPDAAGPLTVKLAIPPASKQDPNSVTTNVIAASNVRFNPMAKNPPGLHPESSVAAALSQYANGVLPQASIYVYGLKETHTELTLYELFSPFGGILNVKLIRDMKKEGNPCKGYGFVNYNKSEDAALAVSKMNGMYFDDKVLQVSIKKKGPDV